MSKKIEWKGKVKTKAWIIERQRPELTGLEWKAICLIGDMPTMFRTRKEAVEHTRRWNDSTKALLKTRTRVRPVMVSLDFGK